MPWLNYSERYQSGSCKWVALRNIRKASVCTCIPIGSHCVTCIVTGKEVHCGSMPQNPAAYLRLRNYQSGDFCIVVTIRPITFGLLLHESVAFLVYYPHHFVPSSSGSIIISIRRMSMPYSSIFSQSFVYIHCHPSGSPRLKGEIRLLRFPKVLDNQS